MEVQMDIMLISLAVSRRPPELEIATAFLGVSRVPVQKLLLATEPNQCKKTKRTGKRTR